MRLLLDTSQSAKCNFWPRAQNFRGSAENKDWKIFPEAKAKDLTPEAKTKAKDIIVWPRGQGHVPEVAICAALFAGCAVIERGCDNSKSGEAHLGCSVDGSAMSNFRSVACYCDTARCNGLSVEALVCKCVRCAELLLQIATQHFSIALYFSFRPKAQCNSVKRRVSECAWFNVPPDTQCVILGIM